MSGVGFWELIILFLIGLIVLGPERLPRVANQLGTWLGQARRMSRVLKRQLEDELNLEKDLNIRPRPAPKVLPSAPAPELGSELDDTYSPAHAADSPGTGVDPAIPVENAAPADEALPAAESHPVDEQLPQAAQADRRASSTGDGDDRATAVGNGKT
jgi:sec-independent protein translocase protein TatB